MMWCPAKKKKKKKAENLDGCLSRGFACRRVGVGFSRDGGASLSLSPLPVWKSACSSHSHAPANPDP